MKICFAEKSLATTAAHLLNLYSNLHTSRGCAKKKTGRKKYFSDCVYLAINFIDGFCSQEIEFIMQSEQGFSSLFCQTFGI